MPPVEGGDVAFVTANVAPINSAKIYGEPQNGEDGSDTGDTEVPTQT